MKLTSIYLKLVIAYSLFVVSGYGIAAGGWLTCTKDDIKDTSYTDTITAPNAIINTYGTSSSKDGQTTTTLENSNGGVWIFGATYLASSIVVQGYDKNANYDPSMCALTFDSVTEASQFCQDLVSMCDKDHQNILVTQADSWYPISVLYKDTNGKIASSDCPNTYHNAPDNPDEKSFPNGGGVIPTSCGGGGPARVKPPQAKPPKLPVKINK